MSNRIGGVFNKNGGVNKVYLIFSIICFKLNLIENLKFVEELNARNLDVIMIVNFKN